MNGATLDKLARVRRAIRQCDSLLVAYSGGVDSAVVLAVAHEQLGPRACGCIAVSPSYPAREQRDAVKLAEALGARVRIIETREHEDPRYRANTAARCYFCKAELYRRLRELAAREGWNAIANGTHADDRADHQHGIRAAREAGIRAPLLDCNVTKADVRAIARHLGVAAWDKPAMPCLASRVPHGTMVTPELLQRVERAEETLIAAGFRQFRVRHHDDLARIELPEQELRRALEHRDEIVAGVRAAGYRHVTLDLAGFRREPAEPTEMIAVPLRVRGVAVG